MNDEQIGYVVGELQKGISKEELKATMLKHDYSESHIDELFTAAEARMGEGAALQSNTTSEHSMTSSEDTLTTSRSLIGYGDLIEHALHEGFANIKLIIPLFGAFIATLIASGLIIGGLVLVFLAGTHNSVAGEVSIVTQVIFGVLGVLAYLAIIFGFTVVGFSLFHAIVHRKEQGGYWRSFVWSWRHSDSLAILVILLSIVPLGGYVFFIIPGLAMIIYTIFAMPVLAKEDIRGLAALLRSTELVYGHWWSVCARMLIFWLVTVLLVVIPGGIAVSILSIFGTIGFIAAVLIGVGLYMMLVLVGVHAMVILYESLASLKPADHSKVASFSKTKIFYIVCGVLGVLLFCLQLIMAFTGETQLPGDIAADSDPTTLLNSFEDARVRGMDTMLMSVVNSLQDEADAYQKVEGTYEGFCSSIVVENFNREYESIATTACFDSEEAFALDVELSDSYYCVDSLDFADVTSIPLWGEPECVAL